MTAPSVVWNSNCNCMGKREGLLVFEFPKLYMLKYKLPLVAGLDKAGWQVVAEF